MTGLASYESINAASDWIELYVLFGPHGRVSRSSILDILHEESLSSDLEAYDQGDLGGPVEDEELVDRDDIFVDDILETIRERKSTGGDHYPYGVDGSLIVRTVDDWRDAPLYAFLAALNARYQHKLPADTNSGARIFERAVVPVVANYWCGKAAHFGWPRDGDDTSRFSDALKQLVQRQLGERLNRDPSEILTEVKDLGVDVVAWQQKDRRPGKSIMLCQCSIGEGWCDKGLHLDTWRTFISFAVPPMRGLAFPFVPEAVRSSVDWEILCGNIGVPFDRIRIVGLSRPGDHDHLHDDFRDWTGKMLEGIEKVIGST